MPQLPATDTSVGGNTTAGVEEKKKKPRSVEARVAPRAKAIAVSQVTPGEKARREPLRTTPEIRRGVREQVVIHDAKPYIRHQADKALREYIGPSYASLQEDAQAQLVTRATQSYLSQVSERATRLAPGLMRENPQLATELLLSGVRTKDLTDVSAAAFDAFRAKRAEWYRKQSEHAAGIVSEIDENTRRELIRQTVRIGGEAATSQITDILGAPKDVSGMSNLEQVTVATGALLAAPFRFGGAVGGAGLRATGAEGIAEDIGGAARWLEGEVGNAVRFAEGLAISGATFNPKYLQGWGDAEEGRMGPVSELFFDISGLDPDGYRGLQAAVDLGVDLAFSEGVLRVAASVKAGRTQPGFRFNGDQFVNTRSLGKPVVKDLWATAEAARKAGASPEGVATILMEHNRGVTFSMAKYLKDAISHDDMGRRLAAFIDESPTIAVKSLNKELVGVKDALTDISKTPSPGSAAIPEGAVRAYSIRRGITREKLQTEGIKASGKTAEKPVVWSDTNPEGLQATAARKGTLAEGEHVVEHWVLPEEITGSGTMGTTSITHGDVLPERIVHVYEGGKSVADPVVDGFVRNLQAKRISLEQEIRDMRAREPVWEFPRKSHMQPFIRGLPAGSRAGRIIQSFFGESKVFDPTKFFNDMSPRDRDFFNPMLAKKPRDWATRNVERMRTQMNQAKVPKPRQRELFDQMFAIKSQQDFFSLQKDFARALYDGLTRGGKRDASYLPGIDRLLEFSRDTLEERITSPIEVRGVLPDGSTVSAVRNALEGADGQPLPIFPSQFAGHGQFPDIARVQELASAIHYMDNKLKSNPAWGAMYGQARVPFAVARHLLLEIPQKILRPSLFVSRQIPMGLKIQADQGLRKFLMDYRRPLWKRNEVDFGPGGIPVKPGLKDLLPEEGRSALGVVASEAEPLLTDITYRISTRGMARGGPDADLVVTSRAKAIAEMANDELGRKLALMGPDDTLRSLIDHPETRLGRIYAEEIKPFLDERGLTPEQWIRAGDAYIEQLAGGDPALRRAIGTREWDTAHPVETGATIERGFKVDDIQEAKSALAKTEDGIPRQELNKYIDLQEERLSRLDDRIQQSNKLDALDVDAVAGEIRNRWQENRYQMPDEVLVRKQVDRGIEAAPGASRLERMRAQTNKANRYIYNRGLPALKLDLTRGSTYRAVLEKTYQDLVDRGWAPKVALEVAKERAVYITKDLHYDISARSSFDRRMKDYFWFSAVWREQLSTYLYKIPSRHYWPIGLGLRTFEAYSILDTLHGFGLLEWDEWQNREGESGREIVMNVPWVTDLVAKIAGNEEAGKLKVGGLNPLTPGTSGILPTLSPGAESILDMTARHAPKGMQPFFGTMSALFTFDQDVTQGPSYLPTPIIAALETVGIHIPFDTLSMDDWRQAENKANVQSLRWAMSDLAQEGVLPPGEDATDLEVERYRDLVVERSHTYEKTLGVLHLIGSAVLPGRFTVDNGVTNEGQRFYDAREALPDDISQDDFYAWQNDYLRKHPEAFPYSVGAHPGKYGTPTYDSSQTIDADDYIEKALTQTHYWMDVDPNDPSVPEGERETIARKQGERNVVFLAADPASAKLEGPDLDALGIPDFEGRDEMVRRINGIYGRFEERYSSEMSDADKQALYNARDGALDRLASEYGPGAERALKFYRSTPAERLRGADYFISKSSSDIINEAQNISRAALAEGSSPQFAAATTGVLADKLALYRAVERYRQADPAFDRELRRAEITLGEKDTTKGRVALYEWIFFGQPDNLFNYQEAIVRGLNG